MTHDEPIRPGYKRTEVGVIPEDWEVDTLESTTPPNVRNGIVDGPFGSNLKTIHYRKSGIPIITSGYVTEGIFLASDYLYVDAQKFMQEKRSAVAAGDIVMAKIGARCGASAILPEDHETGILSGNALKITVDNKRHSTYYIWQVLWNLYSTGNIEELITVGAQPAVSLTNLKRFLIPLPPLHEQTAIAEVLSDVDALLAALERLNAKKRAIKQGAMQALLTGRVRLPGFERQPGYKRTEVGVIPVDWEVKRLGEIADIRSGGTPSTAQLDYWDGPLYWCTPTDITALNGRKYILETKRTITYLGLAKSSAEIIPANSIVMTSRATIGECAINPIPVTTNQGFKSFVPNQEVDHEFLYYLLTTKKQDFISLCGGSTFLEIGKSQLSVFQIGLPSTKTEQTAIAEVLSDMDAEIEALEKRRAKLRAIKQGIMQELLTGRIRLVGPEEHAQEANV